MTDTLTPTERSAVMARVRSRDTRPEIVVRKTAHALGYRFRLHRASLPGRPDLVFPRYHVVVFVHGCFWHRHPGCARTRTPKSRIPFWSTKFEQNVRRDRTARRRLRALGWSPVVIWECETEDQKKVGTLLAKALGGGEP
jgi:DNA mismatch endonuclease (patch repair protein)